jgi:hypothetical protein
MTKLSFCIKEEVAHFWESASISRGNKSVSGKVIQGHGQNLEDIWAPLDKSAKNEEILADSALWSLSNFLQPA